MNYKRRYIGSYLLHLCGYVLLGFMLKPYELPLMEIIPFFILFLFIDVSSKEKYTNMLMVVAEDNDLFGEDE